MDDVRNEFLQKLYLRQAEIERALEQLMHSQREYNDQTAANHINDETDHAQREASVANIYSLIERKARELNGVSRLIRQIGRNGSFGVCEECGDPIPPERLMIMPDATLCVPCQREMEKFVTMRHPALKNGLERTRKAEDEGEPEDIGGLYDIDFEWMDFDDEEALPLLKNEDQDA